MLGEFRLVYATCRTLGCGNEGKSIAAYVPNPPHLPSIACGDCENPITEIHDTRTKPDTRIPEWLT